MDCATVASGDLAEGYLLGRLTDSQRDAYEAHYFECDRCFEALRQLEALRDELRGREPGAPTAGRRWSAWRVAPWAAAAVLVVATAATVWRLAPGRPAQPAAPIGTPKGQSAARTPAASPLEGIARVDPPTYVPLTIRSGADWQIQFESAMGSYTAGRYEEAAARLEPVAAERPAAANARFFLGVCYLMLGRVDDAVRTLRQAIAVGDRAYTDEGMFFLAKALLRKEDRPAALELLERLAQANGPRAAEARRLATAVAASDRR